MTIDVSAELPYGRLETIEVYFEHDGPKFFALNAVETDLRIMCFCTDDGEETGRAIFLYLVMSPTVFQEVRSGHTGLRQAFLDAKPWQLWRITEDYTGDEPSLAAQSIRFADIPDEDLPTEAAQLELETPTAPALDVEELQRIATQTFRTITAVELTAAGESLTEFPLKGVGLVGTLLQDTLDALAQEVSGRTTERGVIAKSVTDEIQMSVTGLRAASFVLVIGTDKRGRLIDDALAVEATLARLTELLRSGHDPEQLIYNLQSYGARARSKFTNLLRAVFAHESGLGIVSTTQRGETIRGQMSSSDVIRAVRSIGLVMPTTHDLNIRRGTLLGSNTRRGTFEIFDNASRARYNGQVSGPAQMQIDGLPVGGSSFVSAVIQEEVDFAAEEQATGRKYVLLNVEPLGE